jgi:hypothetical protein
MKRKWMRHAAVALALTALFAMAAPAGAASRAPAGVPAMDAFQAVLQWIAHLLPAPAVNQPASRSASSLEKASGKIDPDGLTASSCTTCDRSTGVDPDGT